jgi:hypothetical protein
VTFAAVARSSSEKVNDAPLSNVCTGMNAMQTHRHTSHANHTSHTIHANHAARRGIDWVAQCKLALVLSVAAVLATIALSGHVAEPVLIVGIIVVASAVAWTRQEPMPQPAVVQVRSR